MRGRHGAPASEVLLQVIVLLLGAFVAFWVDNSLTEAQVRRVRPFMPPAIGVTVVLLGITVVLQHRAQRAPDVKKRWLSNRPPYPGLEAFTEDDAGVYFGRREKSEELLHRLEPLTGTGVGRFVAVIGPSGSGKSSLIHAGLLPLLARRRASWLVVPTVRPSDDPVGNLASALGAAFGGTAQDWLRRAASPTRPSPLAHEVSRARAADGKSASALLIIDQAEELVTITTQTERDRTLRILRDLMEVDPRIWIVAAARSDFVTAFLEAGGEDLLRDPVMVGPLDRTALFDVILKPAEQAGVSFEPELVNLMVDEAGGGEALPLLAYTLQSMYERSRDDGVMTLDLYRELGGVPGTLSRQADRVVEELAREGLGHVVIPTLLKFVTVEGNPTRRRVARASLDNQQAAVVDAFIAARLLTTSAASDEILVEVTHEALFNHWPPLRQALDHRSEDLHRRDELERAAHDWVNADHSAAYLLRGERLAAAQRWAAAQPDLSRSLPSVARLIEQSIRSDETALMRLSRAVAQRAITVASRDPDLSVLLAIAAAEEYAVTPLTQRALMTAISVSRTRNVLTLHTGVVRSVAWSPDDRRIASVSHDGTVRLWDPRDGTQITVLTAGGQLRDVAWSPDGTQLASASGDGTVTVFDVASGQRVTVLRGHADVVHRVAWSSDGRRLATASHDRTARIWLVDAARDVLQISGHDDYVRGVAWSPDDAMLATSSADLTVRIWSAESGAIVAKFSGHDDWIEDVGWSHDGDRLATLSSDRTVCIRETGTWREIGRLRGHTEWIHRGGWSPDDRQYATASRDRTIGLWDTATTNQVARLLGHDQWVHHVAWSHDGSRLASASYDRTIRVWEVEGGISELILRAHQDRLTDVAWSPEDTRLATASEDRTVRIWDAHDGTLEATLRGHTEWVHGLAWSPNGARVASVSRDRSMRVWDAVTGAPEFVCTGHEEWVEAVDWSPDGRLLATAANDATVRVWDAHTGTITTVLEGHLDWVRDVEWSPDGSLLASVGNDGGVRLWNVAARTATAMLCETWIRGVAWSPDGGRLATAGNDGVVILWDVSSLTAVGKLVGHEDEVLDVAWSSDGDYVVTASADRSARIWNAHTGTQRGVLAVHNDAITAVAASHSALRIATASHDRTAQIWNADIDIDALLAKAKARAFRQLTTEERASVMLPETPQTASIVSDGDVATS